MIKKKINEQMDYLLDGKISFFQSRDYRIAIDPILLAAFAASMLYPARIDSLGVKSRGKNINKKKIKRVAELGVGTGAVMLCLLYHAHRFSMQYDSVMPDYTGFDLNHDFLDLAQKSLNTNPFSAGLSVRLRQGNITEITEKSCFEVVLMNPPFLDFSSDAGKKRSDARTDALYEGKVPLQIWIDKAADLLIPGGQLFLIHRAERIHQIIQHLNRHFAAIILYPLYPKSGRAAKRILIAARLGSKSGSMILPGMLLHQEDGSYSHEAHQILCGEIFCGDVLSPILPFALPD